MADKKTTTKTTKAKVTTTPKQKTVDYNVMPLEDLDKALTEKQQDLKAAQLSHRSGELVNYRVLTETRKDIARIHTARSVREKETK